MPDQLIDKIFNIQGGFVTDIAPQVRELTFLTKAENLLYEVSGAARKVGGTTRINSTAITGSPSILGMFDFWLSGTGGTSTQKFMAVTSDSKVYKEDMDGVFDDITGAATITANAIPVFCQDRDLLTIWFSTNDTPLKWNQTGNVATLGGSPPAGRGAVFHVNRPWTWGAVANPSRLTYGSSTSAEDFTGGDTGSIDIEPEDGDRIIGAVSHKNNLFVFKGPYKGSIHVISGRTVATFARDVLVRGIALQSHNSIVERGDDIWFKSDQGIHSLAATERFGNFIQAMVTPLHTKFFRDDINRNRFANVWGVNYGTKSSAIWTLTQVGASANNYPFGVSYIRPDLGLKPFTWPNRSCQSAAIRINPTTNIRELVFGENNGFVTRQDTATRTLASGTAYNFRIRTPSVILVSTNAAGQPVGDQPVYLQDLFIRSRPVGNYDLTVGITRDNLAEQSYTVNQGSTGAIWGTDVFGTGVFGGGILQTGYIAGPGLSGECRAAIIDIQQGGGSQDADIYEVGVRLKPSSQSRSATL